MTEDFALLVTVRKYGRATVQQAAQAMRDWRGSWDLGDAGEVEIIAVILPEDVTPAQWAQVAGGDHL